MRWNTQRAASRQCALAKTDSLQMHSSWRAVVLRAHDARLPDTTVKARTQPTPFGVGAEDTSRAEPFVLNAVVGANSSCGNEIPQCLAITRFSTVRIDNARLVDQNGDPIPGASFTSASGYDYITAPVPEPHAVALTLEAVATPGQNPWTGP